MLSRSFTKKFSTHGRENNIATLGKYCRNTIHLQLPTLHNTSLHTIAYWIPPVVDLAVA